MLINAFTRSGQRYAKVLSDYLLTFDKHAKLSINALSELVIITPQLVTNSRFLKSPGDVIWSEIHDAWNRIEKRDPKDQIQQWRIIHKYGQEVIPGLRVFRLREKEDTFFCLFPKGALKRPEGWIVDLFCHLFIWHQVMSGDVILHAAGIIRKERSFLFLGPSGAGKTTLATMSASRGLQVIHDDRILLKMSKDNVFVATDRSFTLPELPVGAVFFIHQSAHDQLLPLSSVTIAKNLFENLPEMNSVLLSSEEFVRKYFMICSSLAHHIAGHDLYFRKSPDFWDVIDTEIVDK